MTPVSTKITDGIAIVTIDNPPVNALSHAVRVGLVQAIEMTEADPDVQTVVLACAGRTFIAGADIREFDQPAQAPHLPDLIQTLENACKPWVAAIHGAALGGGLELALGCSHRIADKTARLGLPEVHLGLIPGAGGTVRLPRAVGVLAALEMIAGGKPVLADKALATGLIDQISAGDLLADAVALARKTMTQPPRPPLITLPVEPPDAEDWSARKSDIAAKARGQQSPLAAIQALQNALDLPAADALQKERELFTKLKASPQSAALRHVFFAERSVAKIATLKGVVPRDLTHVGVVGGGTMGAGIAAACLLAGLQVTMVERDETSLTAGLARVTAIIENSQKRGLIDGEKLSELRASMSGSTDYPALAAADLIIEAVYEDMAVKKAVFAEIQAVAPRRAVLATNTSYLDVGELAEALDDPSRLLGLHFFSPAHIMKLLEVICPPRVAPEVLATGFALAKRLGKIAVPSGVCDGFIANRMMSSYRRQAEYLVQDGAWPQEVDAAVVDFGFPMGIFAMQDLAGLDIGWATRKRQAASRPADMRYVEIADRICELGRLGRKTGQGWYDYSRGPTGAPDPVVEQLIRSDRAQYAITPRDFSPDQIMAQLLLAMQREGRAILAEGIAQSAAAIDVVMINGYGFPRGRGGPMYMGESAGD